MRVLLVDDHPDTTEILSILFGILGQETCAVNRGRDALLAARKFDPDLVVLDIGLPDISGYEVARALRDDRTRQRYITAATGWGRDEDIRKALAAGCDLHVTKPIDLAKVRAILRQSGATCES